MCSLGPAVVSQCNSADFSDVVIPPTEGLPPVELTSFTLDLSSSAWWCVSVSISASAAVEYSSKQATVTLQAANAAGDVIATQTLACIVWYDADNLLAQTAVWTLPRGRYTVSALATIAQFDPTEDFSTTVSGVVNAHATVKYLPAAAA